MVFKMSSDMRLQFFIICASSLTFDFKPHGKHCQGYLASCLKKSGPNYLGFKTWNLLFDPKTIIYNLLDL